MIRVFLLLVVLIFTFACNQNQFQTPSETEQSQTVPKNSIIVKLKESGELTLEGKNVGKTENLSQFQTELSNSLKARESSQTPQTVVIQASKKTKYGEVNKLIEIIEQLDAQPLMQINEEPQ